MADSKRETILKAVKALLVNVPGVAQVYRSRPIPFDRGQLPGVILSWVTDTPSEEVRGYTDWRLQVVITVCTADDVPDQVADPIIQDIHSKIMADVSLGGLSMDIGLSPVQNEVIEGDKNRGFISMGYRIDYRTSFTNLSI